ncbi:hypothetical protein TWF696_008022 [Orbilia brochopaga]|uniref:Uncharacterized protein n=1 Tax=Orbilia brochopaga TaxID=3140254 RepID=A0AAV9UPA4_9PEZI
MPSAATSTEELPPPYPHSHRSQPPTLKSTSLKSTSPPTPHSSSSTTNTTIPRTRRLLLHLVFGFLLLNTALFALAVHNVEQTAIVAVTPDAAICPCPSRDPGACTYTPATDTRTAVSRLYLYANDARARWYTVAYAVRARPAVKIADGGNGGVGVVEVGSSSGVEEYKMQMWQSCVWQVRAVRGWRWTMQWLVLPGQCLLEIVGAWVWWRCLVEDEQEEEEEKKMMMRGV